MELSLAFLIFGCLKTVILQEFHIENAQYQQNLPAVSSVLQENDKVAVASVSTVNTNSGLSSETLIDIFNAAKNISHAKGIYQEKNKEGMSDGDPEIRRSIQRKVAVSTFSNVVEKVLKHIDTDVDKLPILDYLEPLVHQFDVAVNFANLGGIQKVTPLLFSTRDDIASSAAMVLGAAMQSNPKVKKIAIKEKLCQNLLKLFSHKSPVVLSRVIFAISSLLRHSPEAQEEFIAAKGIFQLSNILKNHRIATNIKLKIINLLNDITVEQDAATLYSSDQGSQLISKLQRLFTKELQEHDVCKFMPSFLDIKDFDTHQKVVAAMISLHNICLKDFQKEEIIKKVKHLIDIYNPESNDASSFYPAIDMELKTILHSELKSLLKEIIITNISQELHDTEYSKNEL